MNLIDVFVDTLEISNNLPIGKTNKHTQQEIISPNGSNQINIIVENLDTVSSIQKWSNSGKTCALNMASPKRPGGGVQNGARAQEECLFRCSNLITSISDEFYPLTDLECLYTQSALFFKDKNYYQIDPIKSDVITIAAENLAFKSKDKNYQNITKDKIRLILSIPYLHGAQNLILGAWGCGVFNNNPNDIAQYFKEIIIDENYGSLYKSIIFAIINDHNSVDNNLKIFSDVLSQ
jgi:uncharacterized protein (TIGR02452 family)